jgi:hypothetical protein
MKPPKPKPDDAEQSKRFAETARELGADENGKAFTDALKTVVPKAHPSSPPPQPKARP